MEKNKVKNFFVSKYDDPAGWIGSTSDIYWCIYENHDQLEPLLKFFNEMPEDNVLHIASKLVLSYVFLSLKYKRIAEFLLKISKDPTKKLIIEKDWLKDKWSNWDNKLRAIVYLVQLGDIRGKKLILEMEPNIKKSDIKLIAFILSTSKNIMGIELYLYFIDKYDFIKSKRERLYFENKLKKNINKVLNEYTHRKPLGFFFNIELYSREDKKEFQNLVDLFNVMPEDSKKHVEEKISTSRVLLRLNYKLVTNFFFKIISAKKGSPLSLFIDDDDKENAALNLIKMNDERGAEFVTRLIVKLEDDFDQEIIADKLVKINTETSRKLLIELSKKYKSIKKFLQ